MQKSQKLKTLRQVKISGYYFSGSGRTYKMFTVQHTVCTNTHPGLSLYFGKPLTIDETLIMGMLSYN